MPAPFGDSTIGKIHFLTSYVWRFWDRSLHFFELLMCAAPIYWYLRQFGICRHFCRGCGSPGDLQYPGYYQRVDRDTIHFTYPSRSKGLLVVGSMVCFSNSQRLLRQACTPHRSINPVMASYGYLLNPQQTDPANQDALGLITFYPRPDELHSLLLLPITHHSQPPSIPPFFQGFDPASTAVFPIQEHLTIRCGGCQHNHKINRITVYPFMYSVTGKPLSSKKCGG